MKRILVLALWLFAPCALIAESAKDQSELLQVYGSLRPEIIGRLPEDGDLVRRMDDGYSRIGVKGRTTLTGELYGFYTYERRVSANDGQADGAVRSDNNELRQVYVGIDGGFGALSIGRHYGLYYDYIDDELDRHRSHYSDAIVFGDLFVSNAVVYRSPSLGGGDFGMLVELNDTDEGGEPIGERVELAATWRHRDLAVHTGYVHSPFHDGLFGLASSYQYRSLKLTGVYQKKVEANQLISLALDAELGPRNKVRLAATVEDAAQNELYLIAGGDHILSVHFLAFVEYFRKSTQSARLDNGSALLGGFRFDF